MKLRLLLLLPVIVPLLFSCRATKHVGEGEYLLDRVSLSTDNRELKNSELKSYIRQEPNHKTFGLIGLPLFFYNLSNDKDNGWNRWLRRIGTPPVIYDSQLTEKSRSQIEKALYNKGYTDAVVTVDTVKHKKRIKVKYKVESGAPYHIDRITYRVPDDSIRNIVLADSGQLSHSPWKALRPQHSRTGAPAHHCPAAERRVFRLQQRVHLLCRRHNHWKQGGRPRTLPVGHSRGRFHS